MKTIQEPKSFVSVYTSRASGQPKRVWQAFHMGGPICAVKDTQQEAFDVLDETMKGLRKPTPCFAWDGDKAEWFNTATEVR